jgi:hypothetical protein
MPTPLPPLTPSQATTSAELERLVRSGIPEPSAAAAAALALIALRDAAQQADLAAVAATMQSPRFEEYGDAWPGAQHAASELGLPNDDEMVAVVALAGEWRGTGATDRPFGRALHEEASQEFGLSPSPLPVAERSLRHLTAEVRSAHGAFLRWILRQQYQATQALLGATDRAPLFRGVHVESPPSGIRDPELRALASFAYDRATAQCFGELLFVASVPRQRILATPVTGFAAFGEAEVVVLGPSAAGDQVECVHTP